MKASKVLLTAMFIIAVIFSGCKKDDDDKNCATPCQNGGSCIGSICSCPSGYYGDYCQYNNTAPCVTNNTGTLRVTNGEDDPYNIYVDNGFSGLVQAYSSKDVTISASSHSYRFEQVSGYIFTPTIYNSSGAPAQCGTLEISFP